MPEDKRKMLQAMAAKRKADNEAVGMKKPKEAAAVAVVTERKDVKGLGGGKVQKSSPVNKRKEKAKATPAAKKKAAKWDSGADTSEEEEEDVSGESEEDVSGESEEEDVGDSENSDDSDMPKKSAKRPAAKPATKPPPAKKGKAVLPMTKGKNLKGKGKKKADDDSDGSGAENGVEDDDSDLSVDPLDEVNPDNILPSRTRRRTAQPVNYDFGSGDLDEDDDSDED